MSPQAPEPEARFLVLPDAEARSVAGALAATGSRLSRVVLLARQGLLDDAQPELAALERDNPGSPAVARVRQALRALRPPIPGDTRTPSP